MRIIPERLSCHADAAVFTYDLYVKHPAVRGAGQVRYTFTKESCRYQDWLGDDIDYSNAWISYQDKREDEKVL